MQLPQEPLVIALVPLEMFQVQTLTSFIELPLYFLKSNAQNLTRHAAGVVQTVIRMRYGNHAFSVIASTLWNKLPTHIQAASLEAFKIFA